MPVIRKYDYQKLPAWGALKKYMKLNVYPDTKIKIAESYPKAAFVVLSGECTAEEKGMQTRIKVGESYFLKSPECTVSGKPYYFDEKCEIMLLCGNWEDAKADTFRVSKYEHPQNNGTKTTYYRNSGFDNHYHDFDEYWIVWKGNGVAYTEGKPFEVDEGDCIVTGMGHHHDFPIVHNYVIAVALETEGMGQKREGHLWEHKNGPAVPQNDRI